jgi:hypothetical protein
MPRRLSIAEQQHGYVLVWSISMPQLLAGFLESFDQAGPSIRGARGGIVLKPPELRNDSR